MPQPNLSERWPVATVLTACGIETPRFQHRKQKIFLMLQQYLPLAVLKHALFICSKQNLSPVATVLTACGIETKEKREAKLKASKVATVLTACGIETAHIASKRICFCRSCNSTYRLRY